MKKAPYADAIVAEEATTALSPIKVCMHVLKGVRTDFRVLRSATALVDAGFALSIVDVEGERTLPTEEDIQGIRVKHIFMSSWFIPTRFKPWYLVKAVQMIIRGTIHLLRSPADIYHAHDAEALPACYIAARLRGKPLIFDAHELPLDDPSFDRWPRLSALARRFLAVMLRYCSGVIATSPPTAQEIKKLYHVPEVTLVRNVPKYRFVPKSDRLRQHLGLSSDVRIALYQGYLQPDRGLDRLVHAAEFLEPNIVIVMMGKAVATTQEQLEALITSKGLTDRVKIIPPVPYTELLDWTASADVGLAILPLEYSLAVQMMLPNKFFEYLMAGLPVLASPRAITDIIKTYDIGQVVSSLSPADVGAAINALLADPAARARMRRNALEAAQKEFYWEKECMQLIQLYHDILGTGTATLSGGDLLI